MTTTVPGEPVSTTKLQADIGMIREAVLAEREIPVSYHRKPLAYVVPHEIREQDRAELRRLRSEVDRLRKKLKKLTAGGDDLVREAPAPV